MLAYFETIKAILDEAEEKNADVIQVLAETIAESISAGGILHLFGTGHGHMLAEELFYRAGGLVPVNAMLDSALMLHESALASSLAEQLSGYAEVVLSRYPVKPGETLIIASNSGRNSVPIEMAMAARARGLKIAALTSLAHANAYPSRHSSGKHLHEVADFVLDNCGPVGDAALRIEGLAEPVGPTSTVVGAALLHSVVYAAVQHMIRNSKQPPIFMSANVSEGEEHNNVLVERYRARLRHL